jgi:hypothetical protein
MVAHLTSSHAHPSAASLVVAFQSTSTPWQMPHIEPLGDSETKGMMGGKM